MPEIMEAENEDILVEAKMEQSWHERVAHLELAGFLLNRIAPSCSAAKFFGGNGPGLEKCAAQAQIPCASIKSSEKI